MVFIWKDMWDFLSENKSGIHFADISFIYPWTYVLRQNRLSPLYSKACTLSWMLPPIFYLKLNVRIIFIWFSERDIQLDSIDIYSQTYLSADVLFLFSVFCRSIWNVCSSYYAVVCGKIFIFCRSMWNLNCRLTNQSPFPSELMWKTFPRFHQNF